MYQLERTRKWKRIFCALTVLFFFLSFLGYIAGGYELVAYGFITNAPLVCVIMVISLFSAIICLAVCLTINAIEKDIAEWLEILDTKNKS